MLKSAKYTNYDSILMRNNINNIEITNIDNPVGDQQLNKILKVFFRELDNNTMTKCIKQDNNDNDTNVSTDEQIVDSKSMKFTTKETYYFKMIDKYFRKLSVKDIQKMLDIINGKSKISLRLFDWFITQHANKHKTRYKKDGELFYVHISYKAQLKSFKKRYFDPFRRRGKFYYSYSKNEYKSKICTTIGQLNFFRWAFSNDVIKYVQDNYDSLSKAMVLSNKVDKQKKQERLTESSVSKDADVPSIKSLKKNENTVEIKKNNVNINAKKKVDSDKVKIILSFD